MQRVGYNKTHFAPQSNKGAATGAPPHRLRRGERSEDCNDHVLPLTLKYTIIPCGGAYKGSVWANAEAGEEEGEGQGKRLWADV